MFLGSLFKNKLQDEDRKWISLLGRFDERASARDPLPIDLFVKEVLYYLFGQSIVRERAERVEEKGERFLRAKYNVAGCEGNQRLARVQETSGVAGKTEYYATAGRLLRKHLRLVAALKYEADGISCGRTLTASRPK